MTLIEIADWLDNFALFNFVSIGTLYGANQNVLGVFSRGEASRPPHAIGQPSSYEVNKVRLVVHGNHNQAETQALALALFEQLTDVTNVYANGKLIHYVDLRSSEPVSLGMDANKNYEYAINIDIYTRR